MIAQGPSTSAAGEGTSAAPDPTKSTPAAAEAATTQPAPQQVHGILTFLQQVPFKPSGLSLIPLSRDDYKGLPAICITMSTLWLHGRTQNVSLGLTYCVSGGENHHTGTVF